MNCSLYKIPNELTRNIYINNARYKYARTAGLGELCKDSGEKEKERSKRGNWNGGLLSWENSKEPDE